MVRTQPVGGADRATTPATAAKRGPDGRGMSSRPSPGRAVGRVTRSSPGPAAAGLGHPHPGRPRGRRHLPLYEGFPAFTAGRRSPRRGEFLGFVAPLLFGTVLAAAIALVVAVPLAVGIALFISHYAPRRIANALGYLVDLLAAVPSVVSASGASSSSRRLVPVYAVARDSTSASSRSSPGRPPRPAARCSRRPRPRDHDPADHHRGRPRGLPADAAAARGGGAGARRDPLGDDPHRGPAVRQLRHDRRAMLGLGRALGETWRWRSSSRHPATSPST